jgi:hypothetical protein
MAKHVIVGCAGLPTGVGWPRYFQRLPYLELKRAPHRPGAAGGGEALAAERDPGPRLRRGRPAIITHEPGPKGFGPRGWPIPAERRAEIGRFRPGEVRDHGVAALRDACATLDAAVSVFRTGPEFTPSSANRDLMRRFFAEVMPAEALGDCLRVWHPTGLWDPPAAHAFAAELGIVCAHDPLVADPTGAFRAVLRGARGRRRVPRGQRPWSGPPPPERRAARRAGADRAAPPARVGGHGHQPALRRRDPVQPAPRPPSSMATICRTTRTTPITRRSSTILTTRMRPTDRLAELPRSCRGPARRIGQDELARAAFARAAFARDAADDVRRDRT